MNNKASKEPSIKASADGATKFTDSYYEAINTKRASLENFYDPNASIVWNGNPMTGGVAFAAFFERMPATHYDVQSYDSQPMLVPGTTGGPCNYMVIVSGSVKYGDSKEQRGFSETFVLKPSSTDPNRYVVATQGFRLVV
ncbi:NTF2-like protein [Tuber magnatum]|uniref:NTF2-related export protein n=1 Tax=Tuber magnatum TaxID=42249 RepID=A0A317SPG1_9PEZI|nr:NTF2-like protein [Tuber magnatum]